MVPIPPSLLEATTRAINEHQFPKPPADDILSQILADEDQDMEDSSASRKRPAEEEARFDSDDETDRDVAPRRARQTSPPPVAIPVPTIGGSHPASSPSSKPRSPSKHSYSHERNDRSISHSKSTVLDRRHANNQGPRQRGGMKNVYLP